MDFNYSRYTASRKDFRLERFFEIAPGLISWTIIIGMTALSIIQPLIAAAMMVVFVLYWVLRLLYMNFFLAVSYFRLSLEKETDWMFLVLGMDNPEALLSEIAGASKSMGFRRWLSGCVRAAQIKALQHSGSLPPRAADIRHLVILPVLKETRDVIEPGIKSLAEGIYPSSNVLLVIALEERAPEAVKVDVEAVCQKFRKQFLDFLVIEHPAAIPGESRVKGANATWAAKHAASFFHGRGISLEHVIVSCFDADTVAHQDYLACLTYYFMITPSRTKASYQPIPVYYNNLWEVPSFARILDIGASFFQMVEATNTEKLVTFSSHSMSFKALVEVGYWPVDMISDDSAIFWKSFIYYDGDYQVVPIYTTVSMDIAGGKNLWRTFVNIYKQKRRWAWGVENLPIVMRAFLKAEKISWYKKLIFTVRLFDSFISWATWSFLLAVITWLPTLFAGREFATTTMYYMAPRIKGIIFELSLIGLIICMGISFSLLSSSTAKKSFWYKILHIFDWVAIPFVILALSAIPALDAQTRLMFGRYMEFRVTEKYRGKG